MKKMMMTLAVVLAAVAVNAASVNWNSGNMSALATMDGPTGTYAADWQTKVVSYFLVGNAAFDTSAVIASLSTGGALAGGADYSKALGGSPLFSANGTGSTVTFANGENAYGYAVVFNADGTKFAISKVATSALFAAGANATLSLGGAANFTVYDVVPEPTSMALLALGAAALGLRRKFRK